MSLAASDTRPLWRTMAPRKGETDDDRITRMCQKASQTIPKAQMKHILAALKEHPQHIPTAHRQLTTLGAIKGSTGSSSRGITGAWRRRSGYPRLPTIEDGFTDTLATDRLQCDEELQGTTGETEEKPQRVHLSQEHRSHRAALGH